MLILAFSVSTAFGTSEPEPERKREFSGVLTYEYERSFGGTHSVSGILTLTVNDRFVRKQFMPDSFFQLDLYQRSWFHVGWTSIERLDADEFNSGTHHLKLLEQMDYEVERRADGVSFRTGDGSVLIECTFQEGAEPSRVLEVFDTFRFAHRFAGFGELRVPELLHWKAGGRSFSMRLIQAEAKDLDETDFALPDLPITTGDPFRVVAPTRE